MVPASVRTVTRRYMFEPSSSARDFLTTVPVQAAITVLNDRGLDELSLRAIAVHLGIRQSALYHHFANKADLLDTALAQVRVLRAGGFAADDAVLALISVSRYVIGSALEQETARDGGDIVVEIDRDDAEIGDFLAGTRRVVARGPDEEFEVGLAALIRGWTPS